MVPVVIIMLTVVIIKAFALVAIFKVIAIIIKFLVTITKYYFSWQLFHLCRNIFKKGSRLYGTDTT